MAAMDALKKHGVLFGFSATPTRYNSDMLCSEEFVDFYINKGCIIPLLVVPCLVGIMLGSFVGVRLLAVAKPAVVRWIVIAMLAFAGLRALLKGFNI